MNGSREERILCRDFREKGISKLIKHWRIFSFQIFFSDSY